MPARRTNVGFLGQSGKDLLTVSSSAPPVPDITKRPLLQGGRKFLILVPEGLAAGRAMAGRRHPSFRRTGRLHWFCVSDMAGSQYRNKRCELLPFRHFRPGQVITTGRRWEVLHV